MLIQALAQQAPIIDAQTGLSIGVIISLLAGTVAVTRAITRSSVDTAARLRAIEQSLGDLKQVPSKLETLTLRIETLEKGQTRIVNDIDALWEVQRENAGEPGRRRRTPRDLPQKGGK